MSEISGGGPPQRQTSYSGEKARELAGIKPKSRLRRWFSKIAGSQNAAGAAILAGATAITGVTAANEFGVNPVAPVIDTAKTATADLASLGHDAYKNVKDNMSSTSENEAQNEHLRNVLLGIEHPRDGEELINAPYEIVPAGIKDSAERQEMIDKNTLVNVRTAAGTYTEEGQLSIIIDEVPQGATSDKVIKVPGTAPRSEEPASWWFGNWSYKENPDDPNSQTITVTGQVYDVYVAPVNQDPKN